MGCYVEQTWHLKIKIKIKYFFGFEQDCKIFIDFLLYVIIVTIYLDLINVPAHNSLKAVIGATHYYF
jgi:hypothetical protein